MQQTASISILFDPDVAHEPLALDGIGPWDSHLGSMLLSLTCEKTVIESFILRVGFRR
jgi:hypothetical protein